MRIEARAPAKLVLTGEYAVLEGAPAIVAAVNRLVHVSLEPAATNARPAWTVRTDLEGGAEATLAFDDPTARPAWLEAVATVVGATARAAGLEPARLPGGVLVIESAALHEDASGTKLGLGSSASVATAVDAAVTAALEGWGLPPPAGAPLDRAFDAHRAVQGGAGSGVDVAASVCGGVLRYALVDGRPLVTPLALPPGVGFATVWTGVPTSTTDFVARVEAWRARDPAAHAAAIDALGRTAREAVAACAAEDAAAFLAAVGAYREGMDALGRGAGVPILSPAHRALAALAAEAGVAYKPSGAGGGDVGLLFASSPAALMEAGRKAEEAGYGWVHLGIHPVGVEVTRPERSEP